MTSPAGGAEDISAGTIKIIGIGQSLRGDDGAGLVAVKFWQQHYFTAHEHEGLEVDFAELPGLGLLDLLEGSRMVILVDAMRSGARIGTVLTLSMDQLPAFEHGTGSAHGWGVAETLTLGMKLTPSRLPPRIYIVGIEAGDLSLGESLSPGVILALPEAARTIERLLTESQQAR